MVKASFNYAPAFPALLSVKITPSVKYPKFVIPAQAGIQKNTGCRSKIPSLAGIKSGMTEWAI
jgi:hypothetical protein